MNAEPEGRRVTEKVVDFLEDRGITKYEVQRNPSSLVVSLPNEPESDIQRHFEALVHLLRDTNVDQGSGGLKNVVFRDPRNDHAIIIEVKATFKSEGKEALVRALKAEENELRRRGVTALLLFGSAATSKPFPNDVDLLARFRSDVRLTAFDLAGIRLYLEDRLGRRVDLSSEKSFPAGWRERVARSGVWIFDS